MRQNDIFIRICPQCCPYREGCEGGTSCRLRINQYDNGLAPDKTVLL
jgi:hypothetical protein